MRSRSLAILLTIVSSAALAQPKPLVDPAPMTQDALIGGTVKFCVTFKNNGTRGYGPFVDLVFDQAGADSSVNGPCDGVTMVAAEMVGVTPTPVPMVADTTSLAPCGSAAGATHTFSQSGVIWPSAMPLAGAQLATLALPFGSFESTQPEVKIEVTAQVHSFADEGHPLRVYMRGGFRFGATPLNGDDPPVVEFGPAAATSWKAVTIIPRVLRLTKKFAGSENEVVSGPNYTDTFEVKVEVAPGQTLTSFVLKDCATSDVAFGAVTSAAGGQAIPGTQPNCFEMKYASLGQTDTIKASFRVTSPGPLNACVVPVTNAVNVSGGTWQPNDQLRDPVVALSGGSKISIDKKPIAVRKTAKVLGSGVAIPPNLVQYTITFRISDFIRARELVITDALSDGLQFMPGSAQYQVRDKTGAIGFPSPIAFPKTLITQQPLPQDQYRCPPPSTSPCMPAEGEQLVTLNGGTRLVFNLSAAIKGTYPNGVLTGGAVGGLGPPATGTIIFLAQITDKFQSGPKSPLDTDGALDKHDPLLNHVAISATIVTPSGRFGCTDHSYACLSVAGDKLEKRIVGKNGKYLAAIPKPLDAPQFTRGESVTFRLAKTIPSGDGEVVTVRDWLPRPVLDLTGLAPLAAVPLCGPAPPTTVCYNATPAVTAPSMTLNPTDNSLLFTFGNFNNTANTPLTLTIEITRTLNDAPFADGLLFTNEAQECERSSYGNLFPPFCQTAIAQFELTEPALRIHKGILCTRPDCPKPQEALPASPLVNCTAGAACPRVTGVVSSTNLPSLIGVTQTSVDANDRVTFVVAVENLGNGPYGVFDITLRDTLGPGWKLVPSSLCMIRGDGAPLAATGSLFTALTLTDGATTGALAPHSKTSGANIALFLFDATVPAPESATIGACLTNRAELLAYANREGGANFVTAGFTPPFIVETSACIRPKELAKRTLATSEGHTPGPPSPGPVPLVIGEVIRYELRVHIPEGTTSNLKVTDALPPGLKLIGTPTHKTVGVQKSLDYVFAWSGNVEFLLADPNEDPLINRDNDPDCEYIVIMFNALATNEPVNNHGDGKNNQFTVNVPKTPPSNVEKAVIVEPKLEITKTATLQGNVIMYVVTVTNPTVTNPGTVTAFEPVIEEKPQSCIQQLSIVSATAANGATPPKTSGTTVSTDLIPPGGKIEVTYRATLACKDCNALRNDATVRWTSLRGVKGTVSNPTGSNPPGGSGWNLGERNGNGTVTDKMNDYMDTDSASICSRVCGMKFNDENGDGKKDANEPGLSGFTITATSTNFSTITGKDGQYCLQLFPGKYQICETEKPMWRQTFPTLPNGCYPATTVANQTVEALDFGNTPCVIRICGTKLGGPPGAPPQPLAGWTIRAEVDDGSNDAFTTVTGPDGKYCLELPGGTAYRLNEIVPGGWTIVRPKLGYYILAECPGPPGNEIAAIDSDTGKEVDMMKVDFVNVKE